MKKRLTIIIVAVILIAGLAFILYPTLSDYVNKLHQSRAIVNYAEAVRSFDDEAYDEMWQQAVRYNEQLYDRSRGIFISEPIDYYSVLNVTDAGMMAVIDIPKIKVHLPIVHTVDDGALQSNVGHIETSSLPVGGENTHCVLSGHTGLPSARLLTDLEMLRLGDVFTINTLGEILTYQVDQIIVVQPWEADELRIVPGKDYCTLVTCTPYGVNSHRLLVRGRRIETTQETIEVVRAAQEPKEIVKEPLVIAIFAAVFILLAIVTLAVIRSVRNREAAEKYEEE